MQIDQEIDTRGLNCPLPILKAKKPCRAWRAASC
jgi:TusA-related sulfurtransferase